MLSSVSVAPMKYVSGKSSPSSDVDLGRLVLRADRARVRRPRGTSLRSCPGSLPDALGDLLRCVSPGGSSSFDVGHAVGGGGTCLERARSRRGCPDPRGACSSPVSNGPAPVTVAQSLNASAESMTPFVGQRVGDVARCPSRAVTCELHAARPSEPGRSWYANHPPATRNGQREHREHDEDAQTAASTPAAFAGRRVAPRLRGRRADGARRATRGRLAPLAPRPTDRGDGERRRVGACGAGRIGGPGGACPPGAAPPARPVAAADRPADGPRRGDRARSTGGARGGPRAADRPAAARRRGPPGSRGGRCRSTSLGRGGPCPSAGQRRPRRRGTTAASRPLRRHRQVRACGASDASRGRRPRGSGAAPRPS